MSAPVTFKVLFICHGNICRSPAAEIIFKRMVEDKGLGAVIESDSAGMIDYHKGESPDGRMQRALSRRGYENPGVVSRPITGADLERFDLILYMDDENLSYLRRMRGFNTYRDKIRPMCNYAVHFNDREVGDPYFGREEGFNHTVELLEDICANLLARIEEIL